MEEMNKSQMDENEETVKTDEAEKAESAENTNLPAAPNEADHETIEVEQEVLPSDEELEEQINEINGKIQTLMKKYNYTMYGLIVLIVLYLVCLFWIHNSFLLLGLCIPMILLAFYNSKQAKQVRQLAAQRQELKTKVERAQKAKEQGTSVEEALAEPVTAEIVSLNDLPKQYTVLDDVALEDGTIVDHVVISPAGIVVVNVEDVREPLKELLEELNGIDYITWIDPTDKTFAEIGEEIQKDQFQILTEQEIYKILYRLNDLD